MKWKYIVSWIPGIPIAIINGLIRNSFYMQFMNELRAHQLCRQLYFSLQYLRLVHHLLKEDNFIPPGFGRRVCA